MPLTPLKSCSWVTGQVSGYSSIPESRSLAVLKAGEDGGELETDTLVVFIWSPL
jgi:hypothetical protein